jgi:hypothetical protein
MDGRYPEAQTGGDGVVHLPLHVGDSAKGLQMSVKPADWARQEAARIRRESDVITKGGLAMALDFLRVQAGPKSAFYERAEATMGLSARTAAENIADILDGWVELGTSGLIEGPSFESQARVEASTDLMEQVGTLLDDKRIHEAAPIVLAGAALEEFLRSLIARHGVPFSRKPGIAAYSEELRKADVLNAQDAKDITAWAGHRNAAAHGEFDKTSVEQARIMADGINLFMRQHQPSGSPT